MKINNEIKEIILKYESNTIDLDYAIHEINKRISKPIEPNDLKGYWKYTDLDSFVNQISVISIENWNAINDVVAIEMIKEVLENTTDDALIEKNFEALEKKYRKASGSISDWVFIDDISDPQIILEKLKKDNILL